MGGATVKTKDTDAEKMFKYWCECQNKSQVARKFKVSNSTINRISKKNQWAVNYAQLKKTAKKKSDKKIVTRIYNNAQTTDSIVNILTSQFLNLLKPGKVCPQCGHTKDYKFQMAHLLDAIKLNHELKRSNLDVEPDNEELTPEAIEALAILAPILTNRRRAEALGNLIVENGLIDAGTETKETN